MDERRYLTIKEAARLLRVSETTVRRAINAGRLKAIRLRPRVVRVDTRSIQGDQAH